MNETIPCQWFAKCPRTADGVVEHPTLGYVPCCEQCAKKLELNLVRGEILVLNGPA